MIVYRKKEKKEENYDTMLTLPQSCSMAAQIEETISANSPLVTPPRTLREIKICEKSSNCFPEGMELQMGQKEREADKGKGNRGNRGIIKPTDGAKWRRTW